MSVEITKTALDEFDLALIKELEIDARKSYLDLAATLGMSHVTVRRRLQRLLETGLISFVTITDLRALGYLTRATLDLKVRPGKVDAVAAQLIPFRNIETIIATMGRYDMMITLAIRDLEDLLDFISGGLGNISDITETETMLILKTFKYSWSYTGGRNDIVKRSSGNYSLDATDISLIGELELQPRATISQLAQNLGVSRTSVSKKLQTLVDEGIIRIISVPDLFALGYKVWTVLRLKVASSMIYSVAEELARYPNITHIVMTTGQFEISTSALFRDREDMHNFLVNELGNIPGVMQHETMLNTKSYKRAFRLVSQNNRNRGAGPEPFPPPIHDRED
ncbi:MAG: Lrp/AsnC family transcriptional regulator [Dehalococcoidia bacterium]